MQEIISYLMLVINFKEPFFSAYLARRCVSAALSWFLKMWRL